ncbi:MAG: outer membrane receptor protein [Cycloclasticus sp.]|nr:MAG: outer membrane receptor protein [Cycloclasticus sp.]
MSLNRTSTAFQVLYLLGVVLTLYSQLASSKNGEKLTLFNDDIPVVLSATRLAQPQTEAPASITVISREMIKLSGAKNIAEIFRLVPGMHVNYIRGNRAVVGYQGISSEFPQGVQVLIDGKSEYSPLFGGVNWANFPLMIEDIERIEVVRGPNSATFGSNAFQSVVNITTVHSNQVNGLQLKSTLGERGYERTFLRAGQHFGDVDFRVSVSHIDDNGYKNNADDNRQDTLTARADVSLTPQDTLQLSFVALNTLRETVNPSDSTDPTDPRRHQDESHYAIHGKWEHVINQEEQFSAQLSYTIMNSKDKYTADASALLGPGATFSADQTASYDRWDFEFEHLLKPSESTRLAWGIGLRSDRVALPFWTGTDKQHDNSLQRIFANLEWHATDKLIVNIGSVWEHSQIAGDNASPRFALNYLITPKQSLRFVASHAFRTPVLVENNFDANYVFQTGAGELVVPILRNTSNYVGPEMIDSFEVGYHGIFWNNALTLDIKLFRNEYDDLIDTEDMDVIDGITLNGFPVPNGPGTPNPIEVKFLDNYHHAEVNGYEVELNYRPNRQNLVHIGYSYNHVAQNSANDNIMNSIPKDTFNLLAAHTFGNNVWTSLGFYYTGSMEYKNSGNPQGPMRRFDINAGKTFKVATRQQLDINLTLQLALDKNKDFLNEFNLDNRAFIEANYTFK